MGARLIIVSNRVAVPDSPRTPLAGGMAVAVKAALKNRNGVWFGWSGKVTEEPSSVPHSVEVNKVTYVLIDLSKNDIQEYYNGLANSVLWPVLHYRVDLQEFSRADASGYMRVNRMFADQLTHILQEDDVVWIHDYHLMLLARELRTRGHRNKIGFFLHTPCAPPDIIQTLPLHKEIFGGLTYCDLVGFQTDNDRDNYAHYLERLGATGNARRLRDRRTPRAARRLSGQHRDESLQAARTQLRTLDARVTRAAEPQRQQARAWRRPARLFERHPRADQGVRALSRNQPGVARTCDVVATYAEEPIGHQAIWRHRERGDRADRQGQRPLCATPPGRRSAT